MYNAWKEGDTRKLEPVPEEPQSSLTRKFTQAEWNSLKDLRSLLCTVLDQAFPDDAVRDGHYQPVTIWGVSIDPHQPNAKASVVLMHFLRAQNLNVEAAKKMLIDTLRWRAKFDPAKASEETDDLQVAFGKGNCTFGKDIEGRPVQYNMHGRELENVKRTDDEKLLRWRVGLMEQSCRELDFEQADQMIQVHDCAGVVLSSWSPESKRAAMEGGKILRDYYPGTLFQVFFVNVPRFTAWILWLFRPMLSGQMPAKIDVLGVGPETIGKGILPFVPAHELPRQYGGTAEPSW